MQPIYVFEDEIRDLDDDIAWIEREFRRRAIAASRNLSASDLDALPSVLLELRREQERQTEPLRQYRKRLLPLP